MQAQNLQVKMLPQTFVRVGGGAAEAKTGLQVATFPLPSAAADKEDFDKDGNPVTYQKLIQTEDPVRSATSGPPEMDANGAKTGQQLAQNPPSSSAAAAADTQNRVRLPADPFDFSFLMPATTSKNAGSSALAGGALPLGNGTEPTSGVGAADLGGGSSNAVPATSGLALPSPPAVGAGMYRQMGMRRNGLSHVRQS